MPNVCVNNTSLNTIYNIKSFQITAIYDFGPKMKASYERDIKTFLGLSQILIRIRMENFS